jgi:hypothetical protein
MLVSNERAAPIPGCALLVPEHPNLETSDKQQAAKLLDPKDRATSHKQQAASVFLQTLEVIVNIL